MSRFVLPPITPVIAAVALSGCAAVGPAVPKATLVAAVLATPEQPISSPLPIPEYDPPGVSPALPALDPEPSPPEARDPATRIARANSAARIEPTRDGYLNAVQVYAFDPGALFQVYTAPGQITDIALQPGETLAASGPVAAGDTVRWIIGDTLSGTGAQARVHILIKPTRPNLRTNLVINTDRRTYHLELSSMASTYMASVSWRYPQDDLIALQAASTRETARAAEPVVDLDSLDFGYEVSGADVAWRPERAFDDGRQVFIEFGDSLDSASLPPLFVRGADGRSADLVNYRLVGRRLVVDRLFVVAELRLAGPRGREQTVRIEKTDGGRR